LRKEGVFLDKLEYVLTLAEERNLTRAANRLFISQPTLTNYINRLENELGIKLFDRTVQPIEVTEAGLIYIEDKKKIQNRELALRSKLETMKQKNNSFIIGIPPVRAAYDLPKVIGEFVKIHPNVNINIDNRLEVELEKDVAIGKVDVAIGMLTNAYPSVHYELLHEDKTCLLVPRSYECVAHLPKDVGTLEHPYLLEGSCLNDLTMLLSRIGGGHHRMSMYMVEKYGIVPKNTIQSTNMNLLYQLAGEGVGFLFATPRPFMGQYTQYTDKLAFCMLQQEDWVQRTYIGYLDDNPKKQMLLDFIRLMKQAKQKMN
jgi:DNA-binding transcriptional LysR family regulator